MPCLCSLSWYRSVEGAACAESLPAAHAVHANTTRLAALQDDVVALRAVDVVDKGGMALPGVCRHMLALAGKRAILCAKGLAILTFLGNLPQSAVVLAQPLGALCRAYAVARAPEPVKGHPDLHVLRGCSTSVVVLPAVTSATGGWTPCSVGPYAELVADLNELVCGVRVGVAANERGGEVGASAVVATAVGVEALEGELRAQPGGVLQRVWLEKGHNVVLDGDVLAAADGQVLQGVDVRGQDAADEGDAADGRVAEVEAGDACAVGGDDLLEQGVERVLLGLALPAVGRLVARRADGDGGLGQAEGERLPCERVAAQEAAQVRRGVVELEEGGGGELREERLEDGRVCGDDGLEEAEGAEEVRRRRLRAHASGGSSSEPRALSRRAADRRHSLRGGQRGHGGHGGACTTDSQRRSGESSASEGDKGRSCACGRGSLGGAGDDWGGGRSLDAQPARSGCVECRCCCCCCADGLVRLQPRRASSRRAVLRPLLSGDSQAETASRFSLQPARPRLQRNALKHVKGCHNASNQTPALSSSASSPALLTID